jgi:hypothetical protein
MRILSGRMLSLRILWVRWVLARRILRRVLASNSSMLILIRPNTEGAPFGAAKDNPHEGTDQEHECDDRLGGRQVDGVVFIVLEVVADGEDGPHQVHGEKADGADEEGDSGCLCISD